MKATFRAAFDLMMDIFNAGFRDGFEAGQQQTTISSGSGRLSGNKRRPRSKQEAERPEK
jgi:hypothetical protein